VERNSGSWYCAHAIFYFRLVSGKQSSFLVHENVYLVQALSPSAAWKAAEKLARKYENRDRKTTLQLNRKPAHYIFAGIRKVIEVETNAETAKGRLPSGTEVTYSVLEVDTLAEVRKLARARFVEVLYRE
jgi:hypothetical protein